MRIIINALHVIMSSFFYPLLRARRVSIREFSSMGLQTMRDKRPEPGDRERVQLEKFSAHVEGLLLIHAVDMSQYVF